MWRKRIFKWHLSKLPWIWIFGSITKVRTMEKNCYLGRLLWSCLKPPAGFAEQEKKLYWRLDCCSEWLHSLYSGCLWFIFFMSDKQAALIWLRVWLRNHEETTLVFFRSWSRYFSSIYFHLLFDKLSNKLLWLFCFFVIFPMKLHFPVF